MRVQIDKRRFGPWAVITGASSGIGKEFARQIAAAGVHVALVARREPLLRAVGAECSQAKKPETGNSDRHQRKGIDDAGQHLLAGILLLYDIVHKGVFERNS